MSEFTTPPSALRDFKEIPPPTFNQEKGSPYILGTLAPRKLWRERPQAPEGQPDMVLYHNLQSDRSYAFDTRTSKTTDLYDPAKDKDGFNAVVLVSGAMYQDNDEIRQGLIEATASLKPGGSVFLFEKWGTNMGKEWREKIMQEVGLVERNVLTSGKKVRGATLWEAHMPKEGLRNPIDLIENGPYWINGMIGDMKKSYESEGYTVVNLENSELFSKLKKTKFPLKDIHLIRDRMGVILHSNLCPTSTCEFAVDVNTGNLRTLNTCGEEHFAPGTNMDSEKEANLSTNLEKKPEDGDTITYESRPCIYCGTHLKGFYFTENNKQQVQIFCPHDGFVELRDA